MRGWDCVCLRDRKLRAQIEMGVDVDGRAGDGQVTS